MGKFKVGDRVRCKEGEYIGLTPGSRYNLPRMVGYVTEAHDGYIVVAYPGGLESPHVAPGCFDLADTDESPVRMVPTIVPGVYGRVRVFSPLGKDIVVRLENGGDLPGLTSAELTAAIATLTTIRDALDEVA